MHGLACAGGDLSGCNGQEGACASRGGLMLGVVWPGCPVREIMRDARIQAALGLDNARKISPLADWPHGFAAWVPEMLATLKGFRDSRQAHDPQGGRNGR